MVNPENTFFSVKRFIGRKMNEVKEESKQIPYQVRSSMYLHTRCVCASLLAHSAWHERHDQVPDCRLPCMSGA